MSLLRDGEEADEPDARDEVREHDELPTGLVMICQSGANDQRYHGANVYRYSEQLGIGCGVAEIDDDLRRGEGEGIIGYTAPKSEGQCEAH